MASLQDIARDYREAFTAANGYAPTIQPLQACAYPFRIANKQGEAFYTARDVKNLTAALRQLAARKAGAK